MSQDDKKHIQPPILIDFLSLKNPKSDDSETKYEITETAARLSNQLVRDYPRLFQNEQNIIDYLEAIVEELGRLHHDNGVRVLIQIKFGYHALQKLVTSITGVIKSLRKSHKVAEGIIGVIKDVADGHKIHLH